MANLINKALDILKKNGTVTLINEYDETKTLCTEKDIKAAVKKAEAGQVDPWVEAK